MKKSSLKSLFDAMYHGKYDFVDFLQCKTEDNYDSFSFDNREIYKPNKKLKTYHNFLNLFVLEELRINESVVFSYRKGVNVVDAVNKHSQSKYFFQTDLSHFFPSLDIQLVKKILLENVELMPATDILEHIDRIAELITVNGSIPIGFSTSPTVSNACLYHFDNALQQYCQNNSLIYTRYADDLIISSVKKDEMSNILEVIQKFLSTYFIDKITLNDRKTKFTSVGRKIRILGLVILPNGKVTIDMKLKNQVEVLLYYYSNNKGKFLELNDSNLDAGMEKISGYLSYINTVDRDYLNKLRKKYGATIVDLFLHFTPKIRR